MTRKQPFHRTAALISALLLAAAQTDAQKPAGNMSPQWDAMCIANVSYPGPGDEAIQQAQQLGSPHVGGIAGCVTGACFDEQEKLLYIGKPCSIRVGMELHPSVIVYRVK